VQAPRRSLEIASLSGACGERKSYNARTCHGDVPACGVCLLTTVLSDPPRSRIPSRRLLEVHVGVPRRSLEIASLSGACGERKSYNARTCHGAGWKEKSTPTVPWTGESACFSSRDVPACGVCLLTMYSQIRRDRESLPARRRSLEIASLSGACGERKSYNARTCHGAGWKEKRVAFPKRVRSHKYSNSATSFEPKPDIAHATLS
jgi:hypothetical protein